jgi:hypothetical protein
MNFREIFITHATFDSDGRGISIGDNSYVSVAGIWAASSDIDQIWVAPGLDNPLLVITGTVFLSSFLSHFRGYNIQRRSLRRK